METHFTSQQLDLPPLQMANDVLRKCVHCGFCTATCPTYVVLGDELDSPRGRIYQIRAMLERGGKPDANTVKHIDRCLSCLSCMTTCPSGVDYMHLVDHARAHIEAHHTRPASERFLRAVLAKVLPNPVLFRLSLIGAKLAQPFQALMPGRLKSMLALAPARLHGPSAIDKPGVHRAENAQKMRVAVLPGCAQPVLDPAINEATVRLLTRLGCQVVVAEGVGCCGALVHHMGREEQALDQARQNVAAWMAEIDGKGLDAIVVNASGCGTTVKDYGHMLKDDPMWAERAAKVSALTKDVSEVLVDLDIEGVAQDFAKPKVTYHSACSMQHGQKLSAPPVAVLQKAGFEVAEPKEAHLCCGSAGTYNIMQPELAAELGARKAKRLGDAGGTVIAAGNIGCLVQIGKYADLPVVHTVELIDWATGGPKPSKLG